MKKLVNLIFVIINMLILSFSIFAQTAPPPNFDANKGYNWLVSQSRNGDYGNDVMTTAFAAMALKNVGALDHAQQALDFIKSKEDNSKHCWPQGSCKIKDTAFALWVLNDFGEDTSGGEEYLRDSMTSALRDNWFLEVVTSNNGTCKISYIKNNNNNIEKTVAVNQGKFPGCTGSFPNTFFNLNTCLESNLLNNNPSIELDINCNELGPSTIISVIYNSGSNYYIIKEATSSRDKVVIENGCFGNSAGSSCSFETTLYTNWILSTIGSDVTTLLWLRNNFDRLKALDNALLYLTVRDQSKEQYITNLKPLQKNDGSFNKVVFDTAFAVLALKESGNNEEAQAAILWLQTKQDSDGSWENNLLKTALVLYAAFSDVPVSLPPVTGGPVTGSCTDGICNPENGENSQNCPQDCPPQTTEVCVVNGVCESSAGENNLNCEQDCSCGDGVCDSSETPSSCSQDCEVEEPTEICGDGIIEGIEECDIDPSTETGEDSACPGRCQADCTCKKKKGFPWWISIFIVIVLIAAIVFYLRARGGKPPEKPSLRTFASKPFESPKTAYKPPSQPSAFKSRVEDELDKSIEEAKKLLKKI